MSSELYDEPMDVEVEGNDDRSVWPADCHIEIIKSIRVKIHLYTQSQPIVRYDVRNTYTKGPFYCVMFNGATKVEKYPTEHIFCITEEE